MTDLNESVVEVLRLDAEATPGPWITRSRQPGMRIIPIRSIYAPTCGRNCNECNDTSTCPAYSRETESTDLTAYYRTAAPALAREVQRLQAEVERLKAEIQPRIERSIAFQDAMEEAEAERDEARAEVERLKAELKRCRPSCVVCGSSVHSDRFCGDACYHKHYVRLEEDDDDE